MKKLIIALALIMSYGLQGAGLIADYAEDEIPAQKLIGPCVLLDVSKENRRANSGEADYRLPVSRVKEWESRHGSIPEGAIVLLRTGRSAHWSDADKYKGMDAAGSMHFPGFSAEAVQYLISKRISGIGDRFLEGVSGRNAAGHIGKAHAVTRPFVLVHQCNVAWHRFHRRPNPTRPLQSRG